MKQELERGLDVLFPQNGNHDLEHDEITDRDWHLVGMYLITCMTAIIVVAGVMELLRLLLGFR